METVVLVTEKRIFWYSSNLQASVVRKTKNCGEQWEETIEAEVIGYKRFQYKGTKFRLTADGEMVEI